MERLATPGDCHLHADIIKPCGSDVIVFRCCVPPQKLQKRECSGVNKCGFDQKSESSAHGNTTLLTSDIASKHDVVLVRLEAYGSPFDKASRLVKAHLLVDWIVKLSKCVLQRFAWRLFREAFVRAQKDRDARCPHDESHRRRRI